MLKQVLSYKHDVTSYYGDTSNLREVASKHYKNMFYILKGETLIATIGLDTVANDNHRLARGLNRGATQTEIEMWQDEQQNNLITE